MVSDGQGDGEIGLIPPVEYETLHRSHNLIGATRSA